MARATPFQSCAGRPTESPALDPEDRVRVLVFHDEAKLHLQLLRSTCEGENFFGLLRKLLQFRAQAVQRLIEGKKFLAVFLQKLAAGVEGEPSFVRGQQREKQLRALPQRLNRSRHLGGVKFLAVQEVFNIARQFVHPQVTDRNPEVAAGDIFQFVRLVENHRPALGKHAGVGRALGFELDGEVGEEQVVVHDDDVALGRVAAHLGDEAAVIVLAFLAETGIGPRIELVPESAGFGQFGEFGAIAGLRCFLPGGDGAEMLNLFQPAENRLIGEVEELLAAEIVVATLHVADAELPVTIREQRQFQRRDILKEELLLQVLRAG